jgi:hypothetical protein
MTFIIKNDETGRAFSFASEAAYDAALDWYNSASNSKAAMVTFCAERGIDLMEGPGQLIADWENVAMETFATAKNQKISALILAKVAEGMTAREALAAVCGAEVVDQMISDLYDDLRAKG